MQARARAFTVDDDLKLLNECSGGKLASEPNQRSMEFRNSGVAANWASLWFNRAQYSTFEMPWETVSQLVPQVACTPLADCRLATSYKVGRLMKLTAWLPIHVKDSRGFGTKEEDVWRLHTVTLVIRECNPADVLVALGHFIGPDRIVGCGQTCRAALATQNP